MKQGEQIAFVVGYGSAVLMELGNRPGTPRLTIMNPSLTEDNHTYPAESVGLYNDAVKQLYVGLKKYFDGIEQ